MSILSKITIYKTLAFSKLIHLTLVTPLPSSTIDLLHKIQKDFLWHKKNANAKRRWWFKKRRYVL